MIDVPLLSYVATMSVTPGPNNLMLAASGVNFGFRRTLPHMLGVSFGNGFQVLLVASALAWVMGALTRWRLALVLVGCVYLLWLAWRQAHAAQPGQNGRSGGAKPLGFLGAALFQWVNPKGWMMVFNTVLLFLPRGGGWAAALSLAAVCIVINLPCIALWAVIGDRLRQRLAEPSVLRMFNYTMAFLLAATAVWIAIDEAFSR